MFGNPHPIALPDNLVKLCLTDSEIWGNPYGIYFFCKMFLNVHINLHGQFLLVQGNHPFHVFRHHHARYGTCQRGGLYGRPD